MTLRRILLAIFKLCPIDPTDDIWASSAFVETVWTDAPSEDIARSRVAVLATSFGRGSLALPPVPRWPWLFAATCEPDPNHPPIDFGRVVDCSGKPIGPDRPTNVSVAREEPKA
jgi:hypothetical protein